VLAYMSRAAEANDALAGRVQARKIKNKVDGRHGLENAPATARGLQRGQATTARRRVIRSSKWGLASTTLSAEAASRKRTFAGSRF
jgi:hypothetical protein